MTAQTIVVQDHSADLAAIRAELATAKAVENFGFLGICPYLADMARQIVKRAGAPRGQRRAKKDKALA